MSRSHSKYNYQNILKNCGNLPNFEITLSPHLKAKNEVKDFDGLPKKICGRCAKLLIEFYSFKLQTEQLQLMLQIAVSKLKESRTVQKLEQESNASTNQIGEKVVNLHCSDDNISDGDAVICINDDEEGHIYNAQQVESDTIETIKQEKTENNVSSASSMSKPVFKLNKILADLTCCDCEITFKTRSEYISHRRKVRDKQKKDREKEKENQNANPISICYEQLISQKHEHSKLRKEDIWNKLKADLGNDGCGKNTGGNCSKPKSNYEIMQEIFGKNSDKVEIEGMPEIGENDSDQANIKIKCKELRDISIFSNIQSENIHDNNCIKDPPLDVDHKKIINSANGEFNSNSKKVILKCTYCDLKFSSSIDYLEHHRVERQRVSCKVCNKKIPFHRMKKHQFIHVKDKCKLSVMQIDPKTGDISCNICNIKFETQYDYMLHVRPIKRRIKLTNSAFTKLVCPVCGKQYSSRTIIDHMNTHTKQKPYKCETCGKRFAYSSNLHAHSCQWLCDICGKYFGSEFNFRVHTQRFHLGIKPHTCDVCNKRFFKKDQLKLHERTHTGERPHLCTKCGKNFVQAAHLRTHMKITHSSERPFECHICPRAFTVKYQLTHHLKNHNTVKTYMRCGKCYEFSEDIKYHSNLHAEGYRYICGKCGVTFQEKSIFLTHKKSHKCREKCELICNVCNKIFKARSLFLIHNRIHTGEKPYECKWCGKRFTQKCHLSYHVRLHTGEKRYSCPFCEKRFAVNGNLTQHIRTHTGERPFGCDLCLKAFFTSSALRKHKVIHNK